MDDVWVVIGLLLFGSLLFCLCCYKVTNLLYMLYHIDDTDSLTTAAELTSAATTATAVTNSGALAAAPVAFALELDQQAAAGGGHAHQVAATANGGHAHQHVVDGVGQPGIVSPSAGGNFPGAGGGPPIAGAAGGRANTNQYAYMNSYQHVHHHQQQHHQIRFGDLDHAPSTPTLYPLARVGKTASATSLSVGVQYDPRDLAGLGSPPMTSRGVASSRRGIIGAVEYMPTSNGLRSHNRGHHIHLSAPDFHISSQPDINTLSSRHQTFADRHHVHPSLEHGGSSSSHHSRSHTVHSSHMGHMSHGGDRHAGHHGGNNRGSNSATIAANLRHSDLKPMDASSFLASAASTANAASRNPHHQHHQHNHHKHHHAGRSTTSLRKTTAAEDYSGYFGSLGRGSGGGGRHRGHHNSSGRGGQAQISLSESEPEAGWPPTSPTLQPPIKAPRLSSSSRTPTARRYGSIRVAECSFVEAESQPTSPSVSLCEIDSAGGGAGGGNPPPFDQFSGTSSYGYSTDVLVSPTSALPPPDSSGISLPPPPPAPSGPPTHLSSSSKLTQPPKKSLCNGPRSLGIPLNGGSSGASAGSAGSNGGGGNGQQSHIIPPPIDFGNGGGDYIATPLTTTRIGSALNLSSRAPPPTLTTSTEVMWNSSGAHRSHHRSHRTYHHRTQSPPL